MNEVRREEEIDEKLQVIRAEIQEMIERYKPKFGRWWDCKYCHKSVLPSPSVYHNLIMCSNCGAGLYPLRMYIEERYVEKGTDTIIQI